MYKLCWKFGGISVLMLISTLDHLWRPFKKHQCFHLLIQDNKYDGIVWNTENKDANWMAIPQDIHEKSKESFQKSRFWKKMEVVWFQKNYWENPDWRDDWSKFWVAKKNIELEAKKLELEAKKKLELESKS